MSLSDHTREKIENYLDQNRIVLFMKGTPQQPMCGFSARTVGVLDSMLGDDYATVNVLDDQEIREGIKVYGNWPTIPQLYIDKELVGGCDIISAMFNSGELHQMLGMEVPDRTPPEIQVTDKAAEKIGEALAGHEGVGLHFQVDGGWQSQFQLGPTQGTEIVTESNGITLLMDLVTAQRAKGAVIDWVETMQGEGLSITLPQAPPPVVQLNVHDLKEKLENQQITLVDVRNADERAQASIKQSKVLDQDLLAELEAMPKDTPLAFICHHGNASQGAADHFRKQGFTQVFNVMGGINAWSLEVDPSVPRY